MLSGLSESNLPRRGFLGACTAGVAGPVLARAASKRPNILYLHSPDTGRYLDYGKVVTHPVSLMLCDTGPNEIHIPDSAIERIPANLPKSFRQSLTAGHHQNWIRAIRTGSPVFAPIESAFRSDMISQLSQLCTRTGHPVQWDPKQETIVGNDEAKKMIKRPMRAPWGV